MKETILPIMIILLLSGACARGYLIRSEDGISKEVWIGNKKYGPFPSAFSLAFAENTPDFGFVYVWEKKTYVNINDNIFGPYEDAGYLYFYGYSGDYIYYFKRKDDDGYVRYYIIKSGKVQGPYREVFDTNVGEWKHHYSFIYQGDMGYGIEINGYSYGNYAKIEFPKFDPTGYYYCFPYQKNGKWYIRSTYSDDGPYQSIQGIYWVSNDFEVHYNNGYTMTVN
jgi:hypothetical protein